ncbi:hypothetical protein BAUCODRAFT_145454 [Baudoinia panamericana UAMH 10762]|uniref:CNNM transmembrane domain-containing protein n=1 Tax=Baudoinia panamericana (strain UAMH 10762) TaxID=717646 RepID=M2N7R1_BAUPA|nr:uncharacterized protein BAUCODRAFT_145454 [Baudoinia panamericana UAMH 10762]EMD00144.1 hypothetical protein BAUCODRAFT_145454 [Baudoinia panamericana UAMH 10762]
MASYTYELIELGDEAHGLGCACCRAVYATDLPRPSKLSKEEMVKHALRFSTGVYRDWTRLNAILKRFEGTIQRRWQKKNPRQRREILIKAFPAGEIPSSHRPDFAAFRKVLKKAPRSRTMPSQAYLWPYINLEDLQQDVLFLIFLNSRGRNLPELFIDSDIDAAHLGKGWEFAPSRDSEAMLFCDQRTPRTYGSIVGVLENLPCHYDVTKYIFRVHPSLGLLGLEIQAGIYTFLLGCATLILHDIDPSQFTLAPHQPPPRPLDHVSTHKWGSVRDAMLQKPYRLPHGLDLDRLRSLVSARRASAEDHIWNLREDPSYFTETLLDFKEHSYRALAHFQHKCASAWNTVAGETIANAFSSLLFWHEIDMRLRIMPSLAQQLKRADYVGRRLAPADELLWAELDEIVNLFVLVPLHRLLGGLPVSPRLRQYYPYGTEEDATPRKRWTFHSKNNDAAHRVDVIFHSITDEDLRATHQLHPLVQEAQYMLETEPGASELVDSWLMGHFSDLALLSELILSMKDLRPWNTAWRACVWDDADFEMDLGMIFALDRNLNDSIHNAVLGMSTLKLSDECWRYPANKRASKANNEQMRRAETTLHKYWKQLGQEVLLKGGEDILEVFREHGLKSRKLYRTPKWKDPLILPPPPSAPTPRTVLQQRDINTPAPATPTKVFDTPKTKLKVKTRGTPTALQDAVKDDTSSDVEEEPSKPLRTVKISKRHFRVFSALLPASTAEEHQRTEVAWDELLRAMDSIGLKPEKLYGSVWSFTPSPIKDGECEEGKVDVTRPIQFHEPKEVRHGNKVSSRMELQVEYTWARMSAVKRRKTQHSPRQQRNVSAQDNTSPATTARRQNAGHWYATRPAALGLAKLLLLPIVSAAPLGLYGSGGVRIREDAPEAPKSPHDPQLWIFLAIAVVLVLMGGVFAGLTIALMGQDETYLQVMASSGEGSEKKNAAAVLRLLKKGKHWVLVTLLLSNVITNETLPIVLDRSLGGGWPAVVCSTIAIVIFGEVVPQSVCVRYGLSIGAYMAPIVFVFMWILAPVAWPTAKLLDYVLGEEHGTMYKKSGLKTLVSLHKTLGTSPAERLMEDEVNIISSVLDLKEKPVSDVMTPMEDVFTMSADTVLDEQMMDTILSQGYSRIPIYAPDNNQNFIGMLLVKILITYDPEDGKRVRDFALATLPETSPVTSCLDIINFFQEGKSHMVLVSEEPGTSHGALGVVTLEDVIEELIGEEIVDESDVFIDVHKAIRRMTPADTKRYRMSKNNKLVEIDDTLMSESEREAERAEGEDTPHQREDERRKSSVTNGVHPNPQSAQVPGTTFMMRRKSSTASDSTRDTLKPMPIRSHTNTADLRHHLKHLGPSNMASNPKVTKYKSVKIKPGVGTIPEGHATSPSPGPERSRSLDNTARGDGEASPLLSSGTSASRGVAALRPGYGTTDSSVGGRIRGLSEGGNRMSAQEASRFAEEHTSPGASPQQDRNSLRVPGRTAPRDEDDVEDDADTVGELGPSRERSKNRRTARSGSITETTVDVDGVKKVVLETTSSSDEPEGGASPTDAPASRSRTNLLDGAGEQENGDDEDAEDGVKQVSGKRRKKRGKRRKGGDD